MIHKNGVTCKLIQLKSVSDSFLFDQALRNLSLDDCDCPACGQKGRFRRITSYQRSMISVHASRREEISVSVPRVICSCCGHTQAILPDILVPFSSYSIRFVMTILSEYLHRSGTVSELCDKWHIAVSTLYAWIHLFQRHAAAWCRSLGLIVQAFKDMLSQIYNVPSFLFRFWKTTGFFFLHSSSEHLHFPYIIPKAISRL